MPGLDHLGPKKAIVVIWEKGNFEILDHSRHVLHSLSVPAAGKYLIDFDITSRMAKWIFLDDGVAAINDVTGEVYKFEPSVNYNGQGQAPQNATDESANFTKLEMRVNKKNSQE
ncbi:hypothetical protein OUZ56_026102 [Daphnia magna]|uniref:Uncharacterized protein n=1 Tax=Daphnia magna TaxID=35525 RepID=A0ABQ9ZKZ1_9CRUS|nr:hypothetical protein OUZ56_026102 [Daphnia magna]